MVNLKRNVKSLVDKWAGFSWQDVNLYSSEPMSCANGHTHTLRCWVQTGNGDCVPRGVVVDAAHILHHMT